MAKPKELVTTPELTCLKETERAMLFKLEGRKDAFWIPKSQIEEPALDEIAQGTIQEIVIPKWLAEEKDLVDE